MGRNRDIVVQTHVIMTKYYFAALIFVLLGTAPAAHAQSSEGLEVGLNIKGALIPRAGFNLYPSERFEVGLLAYLYGDLTSDKWLSGTVHAAYRFPEVDRSAIRLGALLQYDSPDGHDVAIGPLFGFDYSLSERIRAYADLVVTISDGDFEMANTGVGLVYRLF